MRRSGHPTSQAELAVRISWRGWVLAALGLILFLAGMWRIDGVMAAMGLASLGLLALARWLAKQNLSGLALNFQGPRRVEAGKGFTARLTLRNHRGWLDAFGIGFGVGLCGERGFGGRAVWLESGGSAVIAERISLGKRACSERQQGWAKSAFPLGLFEAEGKFPIETELGVLPRRRVPAELRLGGYLLEGLPMGEARNPGAAGEWRTLREWRSGDSVRRVAWAASLRSQQAGRSMLVREDEPPGSQAEACLVLFHSYGADGKLIRPDRFEKALELLGGSLGMLQSWGIPLRWMADFDGWKEHSLRTRGHLGKAREILMKARRAAGTEAHDLQAAVARATDHECLLVISDMPPDSWAGALPQRRLEHLLVDISKYDSRRRSKSAGAGKGGGG